MQWNVISVSVPTRTLVIGWLLNGESTVEGVTALDAKGSRLSFRDLR